MMIGRWSSLAVITTLAACSAVGPDYGGPPQSTADAVADFPSAVPQQRAADTLEPAADWWRRFEDPQLDALIARAAEANYDIRIAVANVEGARAVLEAVDTRRRPSLDANALVEEKRDASGLLVIADPDDRFPTISSGSFSLDLSWEIDLFGRVRRSIEAAAADLGSLEAVQNAVMTSVLAEVARAYVDLRGAQIRIEVAERNVHVQEKTLELVTILNREGAATELDLERARTQLLGSQATIPTLRGAERAALNRLATLTAQPLGQLDKDLLESAQLPMVPDTITVGTPAELLRRRPDIRIAERALAAAAARIGVATADLFPTVTLGGSAGLGGAPLSSVGTAGSPFFALGPSVTWNLFDRRAIYARIREQDSVAAANLARYEAAVTGALEEVDSALNAWVNERERRSRLDAARESSRNASRLARLRYREGVEDFLAVLDAERNLLAIEDQLAQSEINLARGVIAIQLALGRGWEAASAPVHTPYVEQD